MRGRVAAAGLLAVVFAAVAGCGGPSPTADAPSPTPASAGADARAGEYLATAGLCAWCHTPETSPGRADPARAFAGGRAFKVLGVGTVYSANITQDLATGIGGWSDGEVRAALFGNRPDGAKLAPPMPFFAHAYLSTKDLDDIVAFLRGVRPVENRVPESDVDRQLLPSLPRARGSIRPPTEGLARGRFVAQAIASCGLCHTSSSTVYEPDNTRELAGGSVPFAPGIAAPNLTPDMESGLGAWSDAEIIAAVRDGIGRDGRPLDSLMPSSAYSNLSESDLALLVRFLRSLPPLPSSAG